MKASTDEQADKTGATLAVWALAGSNVVFGNELAVASGQVIVTRMALGMKAMGDPANADHRELARILPEKSEALSAAGAILLQRSGEAVHQAATFAVNEMMAAARATMAMATCSSPTAIAAAHGNFVLAWLDRVTAQAIALGMMAVRSQHAAMAPFHQAVIANAERLGR